MNKYTIRNMHHIGFIVQNIEETLQHYYQKLNVKKTHITTVTGEEGMVTYRGKSMYVQYKVAFIRVGLVRMEFIEHQTGVNPWSNFLEEFGQGPHHMCYPVNDLESAIDNAQAIGMEIILQSNNSFGKCAYIKDNHIGCVIELFENN